MINFCIGLLVGLFGINLIDSLNNILAQVQEAELPPENTCCIGFQAPETEEEYYEEEEE